MSVNNGINPVKQSQSLADWLCYLENIHPANIEMGLGRVGAVGEQLKLTEFNAQVITVAGTNGKGSTCAFLEQILLDAGYNVGVTSSPHIQDYRERVRVNGQMLSEQAHVDSFEFIEAGRGDTTLTYFEFTTLSALKLFQNADLDKGSNKKLDIVILEIGLGGRYDAANIVSADVAVITTIDIDHADWLGTDKRIIAREKSGIFRKDKVALCGVLNPPLTIAEYANEIGANLRAVNQDYSYTADANQQTWSWNGALDSAFSGQNLFDIRLPKLPLQNAATAIAAIKSLSLSVADSAIYSGIANARLPGRMQCLGMAPQQYLDVAHNPESARYLASQLIQLKEKAQGEQAQHNKPVAKVIAVLGMLKDKDIAASLNELCSVIDTWHVAALQSPRAASLEQLTDGLRAARQDETNDQVKTHDTIAHAWQIAVETADCNDIIIGFGSFFTVAEITQQISD